MALVKNAVAWNIASLGVLALSGIATNLCVAKYYDAAVLGLFNQCLAFYFITSQIAVWSVQFSTLRAVSLVSDRVEEVQRIISSALLAVIVTSIPSALVLFLLRGYFAALFESRGLATGLSIIAPALILYSCNKVMLSALNGLLLMGRYAAAQTVRGLSLFVFCFVLALSGVRGEELPLCLLLSEAAVTVLCTLQLSRYLRIPSGEVRMWSRVKEHLTFGSKGLAVGALIELNVRVDVLVLGLYLDDARVGVYSFASLVAEGYAQLLVVIRNFFNPTVARLVAERSLDALHALIAQWRLKLYLFMAASAVATFIAFQLLRFVLYEGQFAESLPVLVFLLAGIWAVSGFAPFDWLFIQGGHPLLQAGYVLCNVLTNIGFNLLLVPKLGIYGAALGTLFSLWLSPLFLMATTSRFLKRNVFLR